MIRFVWCALLLTACGATQVPAGSSMMRTEHAEQGWSADQPTIHLFGWGVRGEDGRQYDSIESLDHSMRAQLEPFLPTHISDAVEARRKLRAFSVQLLTMKPLSDHVLSQQGQFKHHQDSTELGSRQVIRSITRSPLAKRAHCYEMRKVYTEARQADMPGDAVVLESWKKWGITPKPGAMPNSIVVNTKAFLLLDLAAQLTRLYVYEESDGVRGGELTEVVIQCPTWDVRALATVDG
jgi:hypothetical protein